MGQHILAEFYGCPAEILNDRQRIERLMVEAALETPFNIFEHEVFVKAANF
ncbi:MAG TPA: S-adenosylmethionine decarboxylase [Oscillospiraceae bacterium]|nr:S-adenosylmethionine decarboxylase [Oscillospiraceae bacterium]